MGLHSFLRSYALAAAGPIVAAGSQLLLSFQLLHHLTAEEFGAFSFMFIALQLGLGVSNALLCAPYPVLISVEGGFEDRHSRTFLSANLLLAIGMAFTLIVIALAISTAPSAAATFGFYTAMMMLRWFARSFAYAHQLPKRVATSDISYGSSLVACIIVMQYFEISNLTNSYISLALSSSVGLANFGSGFLYKQFFGNSITDLLYYRFVWHRYSKWSLIGVLTTEGTTNAHAYVVTIFGGPGAFAPIAATALLIRPIQLVTNALTDYERPRLARLARDLSRRKELIHTVSVLRLALLTICALSLIGTVMLLEFWPHFIFPAEYSSNVLWIGALLWMTISLVRSLRTPESLVLQARGEFRILASFSIWSCFVSIGSVTALIVFTDTIWSLAGILLGELAIAYALWSRAPLSANTSDKQS